MKLQVRLDTLFFEISTKSGPDASEMKLPWWKKQREIIVTFFFLGITAFGGPQAHIGILLETFVKKKKWIDEKIFSELLALGQGLPGESPR